MKKLTLCMTALALAATCACQSASAQKPGSYQTPDQNFTITKEAGKWTYRAWNKPKAANEGPADVVMTKGTAGMHPQCIHAQDFLWRQNGKMISVTIGDMDCLDTGAPKKAIGEIYFFNTKTGEQTGQTWVYKK